MRDIFVGVVLLNDQEEIYLIKEDDKNEIALGRWNLPGGSVDGDETLVEAAARETQEETGYEVEIISLLGCYKCHKGANDWIYVVFESRVVGEASHQVDSGVKEGRWFSSAQFRHMDDLQIVHPDMQLVYDIALSSQGLSTESVKSIDYD